MPFRSFCPGFRLFPGAPPNGAPAPIRPTQKALRPAKGAQCFCFICLEKLGLDIAHLEGADDAAVLALGDT